MAKVNVIDLLRSVEIDQVAEKLGMRLRVDSRTRMMALCPFHEDKTPSLLIDTDRSHDLQHFHCFACGEHGHAIDLVKGRLQVDFLGAIEWLGANFSTNLQRVAPRQIGEEAGTLNKPGLERGYEAYRAAAEPERLAVWAASRGFDPRVLERAGFVYAEKNALTRKARLAKMSPNTRLELMSVLEDANLVRKLLPTVGSSLHIRSGSEAQYVDAFVGERVVFPIYDEKRKLVGLVGRAAGVLAGAQNAKYLFTKNFNKSRFLYRADESFRQLRARAKTDTLDLRIYICEGFLDALRIGSIGLPSVAVMGATISKEQIHLLKDLSLSLSNKQVSLIICVCFDRDEAGLKGASATTLTLLDAGLDVEFIWPTDAELLSAGAQRSAKDPDEYLAGLTPAQGRDLLARSTFSPGVAVLANRFGVNADELLDVAQWAHGSPSRKFRAFEKALSEFRRVKLADTNRILGWIGGAEENRPISMREWLDYQNAQSADGSRNIGSYLTNSIARLNHARLLAYRGSRRGELACDEPRWERLDIAATTFNLLLTDRLKGKLSQPIGPFDAVWVPRSFGGSEARLKVMPLPEDLIVQQYLLNELLTERWDSASIGGGQFSQYIPAVRHYREERKTITTGFGARMSRTEPMVREGDTLSFAYQIDMDVLEGRQPATDQGMFRPFHECWHDFMQSLKQQAKNIGHVHAIRLDVSRYYDRIRRSVMRDSLQGQIQAAFESLPDDAPGFADLSVGDGSTTAPVKAARLVDQIADLIFGYPYLAPDTGLVSHSDQLRGIPQGPVISAWLGSIILFPVDQVASGLMQRHNTSDKVRLGYARYVDDIVLLADSAPLLEEMREAIDAKTRSLELTLLAKADAIPPMSAKDFSVYINEGRMLDASGPTWSPPIVGDGESGWEFWSSTASSDRQSALQLLSNLELYKSPPDVILNTVRTAFLATDLRASELSKGARLLWYAVSIDAPTEDVAPNFAADAWARFEYYWKQCTSGTSWQLNPERNGWESTILFALEGLEKLIDHTGSRLHGLSAEENLMRQRRIRRLAEMVGTPTFKEKVFGPGTALKRQTERRFALLEWKAAKAIGRVYTSSLDLAHRSQPFQEWLPFEWFHSAIERLTFADHIEGDPLSVFVDPYSRYSGDNSSQSLPFRLFGYFLPDHENREKVLGSEELDSSRLVATTLQTFASVVPKQTILTLLVSRLGLLGIENGDGLMLMPPLPGVEQKRIVACQLTEASSQRSQISSISTFSLASASHENRKSTFIGSAGGAFVELAPIWDEKSGQQTAIFRQVAPLPDSVALSVLVRMPLNLPVADARTPQVAAKLYRNIVNIVSEYGRQNPGLELIPAWPYIALDEKSDTTYLLCEGVQKDEVGNRAFIRDGGRALRTVEVPIYEAHLWRAGMALSDFLGFHDDITKFSSTTADVPLDDTSFKSLAQYILRSQCRKLRGAFANSQISRRVREDGVIPATIERALELMERFPSDENCALQLKYVLAIEVETVAMRMRLQEQKRSPGTSAFLGSIAGSVLAKLPLAIGESLATDGSDLVDLRRDIAGVFAFARSVWHVESDVLHDALMSWKVLRAGVVCLGIRIALQGVITSLRAHSEYSFQDSDFPPEWEIPTVAAITPSAADSESNPAARTTEISERTSLLEILRRLVGWLSYRLRATDEYSSPLSSDTVNQIRHVATVLAGAEMDIPDAADEAAWPFIGVSSNTLRTLNLALLESVVHLVRKIDRELGLQVILVKEQVYGFNAQTRRFTDSKNRTWDIQTWMISQFPMRAKSTEEQNSDGRILKVWSEIFDRNSGRLLSVSVLGEPFASISIRPNKPEQEDRIEAVGSNLNGGEHGAASNGPRAGSLNGANERHAGAVSVGETEISVDSSVAEKSMGRAASSVSDLASGLDASVDAVDLSGTGASVSADSASASRDNADARAVQGPIVESTSDLVRHQASPSNDVNEEASDNDAEFRKVSSGPAEQDASSGMESLKAAKSSMPSTFPYMFRRQQQNEWQRRAESKNPAHVRIALFQWDLHVTYSHPMIEASPCHWPIGARCKKKVISSLVQSKQFHYEKLIRATERPGNGHGWTGVYTKMPSWAEHRRRRLLERVVNACADFGVDLLVLPEYSIRPDTITWLKELLIGKRLAVLAGTFMEFSDVESDSPGSAKLNLLWPVPDEVLVGARPVGVDSKTKEKATHQGPAKSCVLQLERRKKYRSVGLSEFIRPATNALSPLFVPSSLVDEIAAQHGYALSSAGIVKLLAETRLPLRYFIELICSEVFLLTSPANYPQMAKDYVWMRRRFGHPAEEQEVLNDVRTLASFLSIGGSGHHSNRRSIAVVPAATTRTADYWIAGQAALLAAGTTTVFCNGTGEGLKGGSCFIGHESWKGNGEALGYISSITPYHGWSKGIYYNSKSDPLSVLDQALVIADIDPHNMLEGKPRPQMLPVPLQLVAYLPIAETANIGDLNRQLCAALSTTNDSAGDPLKPDELPGNLKDASEFWESVAACQAGAHEETIEKFARYFADPQTFQARIAAAGNNGARQLFSLGTARGPLGSPAYYDWIDVELSLSDADILPKIDVPPWKP